MSDQVPWFRQDGYLTLLFQGDIFFFVQVLEGWGLCFIDMSSHWGRILNGFDLGFFSRHAYVRWEECLKTGSKWGNSKCWYESLIIINFLAGELLLFMVFADNTSLTCWQLGANASRHDAQDPVANHCRSKSLRGRRWPGKRGRRMLRSETAHCNVGMMWLQGKVTEMRSHSTWAFPKPG